MTTKQAAFGLALGIAAAVTMSARAAQPVNLGVEKGLWKLTTHTQVKGALPPRVEKQLQSMPAAERARIQAAMRAAMAAAQRERVFKECLTARRLSNGFAGGHDPAQCKSTLLSNTRTDFEYHKVCALGDGKGHTETARFHMQDPHHVTGTVDVVQTGAGRPLTVHETVDGKWLGSSCAGVKDRRTAR